MGYEENPDFERPDDLDAPIWRYISFTKLVSLLSNGALYFCRADRLGDAFEGSYPASNLQGRPESYRALGLPEPAIVDIVRQHEAFARNLPKFVFINCWTLSDYESVALWNLYSSMTQGVALRSTFRRLTDSLRTYPVRPISVGRVRYINYDGGDVFSERNVLNPFVHKRRSYDFERELRAFIMDLSMARGPNWSEGEGPPGIQVNMGVTDLLERIHVAPLAPVWFAELVRTTVDRLAPGVEVRKSVMTRDPMY